MIAYKFNGSDKNTFKRPLFLLLLYVFLISTLVFPVLFINKLMFFFIMAYFFLTGGRVSKEIALKILILMMVSLYGLCNSIIGGNDFDFRLASQIIMAPLVFLLVDVIKFYQINVLTIIYDLVKIYCFIVLLMLSSLCLEADIMIKIIDFFRTYSSAGIGYRDYLGEEINFFYVALGSFIFLLLPLYISILEKNNAVSFLLFCLILISGSRGLIFSGLIMHMLLNAKKPLYAGISAIFFIFIIGKYGDVLFSSHEYSNLIKLMYVLNYFEIGELNVFNFLFGNGLGTYFFNIFKGEYVSNSELIFFDFLRFFGFPLAVTYFVVLATFSGDNFKHLIFVIIFLIASQFNPVLVNSIGFSTLALIHSLNYKHISIKFG